MQFIVTPAIFEKVPTLLIGVISCKNIRNVPSSPEVVSKLREAERSIHSSFADPDALKQHPNIAAIQEVHRAFGSNPNKFPPSPLALAKRVVKGGELRPINTLVDLYNAVSLKYLLPVGGEDLDTCKGDIQLTAATGGEPFTPLGETAPDPPLPGEFVYRDDEGIICRRLNWREGLRTCLTEKTRNAVLVIEAVPPTSRETLQAALDELAKDVAMIAGGTTTVSILDREHSSVAL